MYKKLLTPLDGSEFAECGLGHTKIIAIACNCPEVVFLRVIEPDLQVADLGGVSSESWYRDAQAKTEEEAKKYVTMIADRMQNEGLNAKGVVLKGVAADEILEYAKNNGVDLIIMSTHGRSGVSRWAMGSVADKIVRHSSVPVLLASPSACRIQ
jgi:nucleotide-binding universal stress UspA family protein